MMVSLRLPKVCSKQNKDHAQEDFDPAFNFYDNGGDDVAM